MTLRWYSTVIESTDHRALAHWWSTALGWEVMLEDDEEAAPQGEAAEDAAKAAEEG